MPYFALVSMAGKIEQVVVAGLEWPHTQPGKWVEVDGKARPSGAYNFLTGEFE